MKGFEGTEEHNAYVSWLEAHPEGFVLHFNIGDTVLHQARCHCIGGKGNPPTNGLWWTAYRKLCSDSRADLREVAKILLWPTDDCKTCNP